MKLIIALYSDNQFQIVHKDVIQLLCELFPPVTETSNLVVKVKKKSVNFVRVSVFVFRCFDQMV